MYVDDLRQRRDLGSVAFHASLLLALWGFTAIQPDMPEFEVYRVKLYSPPPQVESPAPRLHTAEPTAPVAPRTAAERPSEDSGFSIRDSGVGRRMRAIGGSGQFPES